MAIDALLHAGTKFSHDYHHDLESLFYVICWICTMYSGPNGKMRKESEYKSSNVASWNVRDFSDESLKVAARAKRGFTKIMEDFRTEITDDFHPYFTPIFECMCEIRFCLFPTAMEGFQREENLASMKALQGRTDPEGIRKYRKQYLRLPHCERDYKVVFEELFAVID